MYVQTLVRRRNTRRDGSSWSEADIEAVWRKGQIVPGYDPSQYRKDSYGSWIQRNQYGRETDYGWEIDHIIPVAHGGGDELSNLQPLQWLNNRRKGDS